MLASLLRPCTALASHVLPGCVVDLIFFVVLILLSGYWSFSRLSEDHLSTNTALMEGASVWWFPPLLLPLCGTLLTSLHGLLLWTVLGLLPNVSDTWFVLLIASSMSTLLPLSGACSWDVIPKIARPSSRPLFITDTLMSFSGIKLVLSGNLMVDCVPSNASTLDVLLRAHVSTSLRGVAAPALRFGELCAWSLCWTVVFLLPPFARALSGSVPSRTSLLPCLS